MDSFGNGPAVVGAEGESSEDQEVQRALRKVDTLVSHLLPLGFYRDTSTPPVEAQGGETKVLPMAGNALFALSLAADFF